MSTRSSGIGPEHRERNAPPATELWVVSGRCPGFHRCPDGCVLRRGRRSTILAGCASCRRRRSATISSRLPWCFRTYASRFRHTSAMISSRYIFGVLRQQLQRRADFGTTIARSCANRPDDWLRGGIVDMAAIPGQKVVGIMNGRGGDVKSIRLGRGWHAPVGNKPVGKFLHFIIYRQHSHPAQPVQPSCRCVGIACGCLGQDQLRDEKLILRAFLLPPLNRNLLPRRRAQIPAWQSCQVAYHRGFDIQSIHDNSSILPRRALCKRSRFVSGYISFVRRSHWPQRSGDCATDLAPRKCERPSDHTPLLAEFDA
jgi:hypothetical protein